MPEQHHVFVTRKLPIVCLPIPPQPLKLAFRYDKAYTNDMTKANRKVNKTQKIELRVTPEIKGMAKEKALKAGFTNLSAWMERLIKRAR